MDGPVNIPYKENNMCEIVSNGAFAVTMLIGAVAFFIVCGTIKFFLL